MRMNRIILASHGGLSAGMKDTVQMILGELPNLYALATLRDETEPITVAARRLLEGRKHRTYRKPSVAANTPRSKR